MLVDLLVVFNGNAIIASLIVVFFLLPSMVVLLQVGDPGIADGGCTANKSCTFVSLCALSSWRCALFGVGLRLTFIHMYAPGDYLLCCVSVGSLAPAMSSAIRRIVLAVACGATWSSNGLTCIPFCIGLPVLLLLFALQLGSAYKIVLLN